MRESFEVRTARQVELKSAAIAGDASALWKLVDEAFYFLASLTLRKLSRVPGFQDMADAEQELRLTLHCAAQNWDPERGSWLTFARHYQHQFWRNVNRHRGPVALKSTSNDRRRPLPTYLHDTEDNPSVVERACGAATLELSPDSDLMRVWRKTNLSPREEEVIERRFLHDEELSSIGESFGVCRERVRQIEAEALGKLRKVATVGVANG